MQVLLHRGASLDLEGAVDFYEFRRAGLGQELIEEVVNALDIIAEVPQTWPHWPNTPPRLGLRRFVLTRFPFALPYVIRQDRIVVLAVAHVRRRERYWMDRVGDA